jgi:hypothetical protein
VKLHSHAIARMLERGATEEEVAAAIREGEQFPAKFARQGFRRNFPFKALWRGRRYHMKQDEAGRGVRDLGRRRLDGYQRDR